MSLIDNILNIGEDGYGGVLNTIGNAAGAVGRTINKINGLGRNEKSVGAIRDINTNGFLAQESLFRPNFFARAFDEPTYLSFRIEFMFNDPSNIGRNTAYNNSGVLNSAFTSSYYGTMYDYMPEPLLDDYGEVELGKDSSLGKRYSTEHYLDAQIGDHGRASLLHAFKNALMDIEDNFPYYFTSISGLDSITKVNPENGMRVKDGLIELECYEGIDLKITQLMQLYRKVAWDDVYQRWVLPDMMRYFGMRIYVSEIRLFSDVLPASDINNNKLSGHLFDMSNANERNMSYRKSKNDLIGNITNGINNATAVSQAFLGTKSVITKALNYTSATINTGLGVYNTIKGMFDDIMYCNNAINTVMPTLCFECHMCEFDISETLSHINSLKSSNKGTESPRPKIKIKVGNIKEKQTYPLNWTLIGNDRGYAKTLSELKKALEYNQNEVKGINDFTDLRKMRDSYLRILGNYIDDAALNRRYKSAILGERIDEYVTNLEHDSGISEANAITVSRFNSEDMINYGPEMNYNPSDMPQSTAQASLFSTAMNEAVSVATRAGVSDSVVGTKSLATNPTEESIQAIKAVGETLNAAVEKIYGGPEITSMAAQGVNENTIASIANNTFEKFIQELETSTATSENSVMRQVLKNYRMLQKEAIARNVFNSTATSSVTKLND